MLEKVIQNTKDLDLNDLVENDEYVRRALVVGHKSGVTALEKGFFTFYLKDRNGNLIAGRSFDVKNFIESGFDAASFKNKLVTIDFKAQIFNGSWSLIVNSIKIADDQSGYENFVGKIEVGGVEFVEKLFTTILGRNYQIPVNYLTESVTSVGQGKSGGIGLLFVLSSKILANYRSLPTVDAKVLFEIFDVAFRKYCTYLKMKDELDVISNSVIIDLLTSVRNQFSDNVELAIDCTASLMGLTQPQHLYSHLICSTVTNTLRIMDLASKNSTLPLGSNAFYKGVNLLRY